MSTPHRIADMWLLALLAGCASTATGPQSLPAISLFYESRGAVGLEQRLSYYENGTLVLEGTDWKTYRAKVTPERRKKIGLVLESPDLDRSLLEFGQHLRYEDCFVVERLTIEIGSIQRTARIDALEEPLLDLARLLETTAQETFGRKYSISVIDGATKQICEPEEQP